MFKIHNHIHAAWCLANYGYRVRRIKVGGIYRLFAVKKFGSQQKVYMTQKAVINMARKVSETNGTIIS